jgi:hypothetical protein
LIVKETPDGLELSNGIRIEIMSGDWRTIRGFTLVAAIVDEAAFFGVSEESKVRSDSELMRALKPGLATTGGKLIAISSPYAKKGWCFTQWKKHFGNLRAPTLVWNCPSRTMNPLLLESIVEDALQEDRASALAEYMGQFREDVSEYLPRSVVESAVMKNRIELMPQKELSYQAFVDLSGGRHDDAALAIGHKLNQKAVVDFQKRYPSPFNPNEVIGDMAASLRRFGIRSVTGDNYAADFNAETFKGHGITYTKAAKPKSELYCDLLPRLCSGGVELLENEILVNQLSNLERRTRSGGRDIVDHPAGAKDDLANAVAGLVSILFEHRMRAGPL